MLCLGSIYEILVVCLRSKDIQERQAASKASKNDDSRSS